MRASKISSAANYAAAQAKPDANKADAASPFAALLDTVSSKDAVRDANRPPQKNASKSDDKGNDDKSAKSQDDQAADTQTASSAHARTSQTSKPEKSDKAADKNQTKAGDDSDPQASAIDIQASDAQAEQQALVVEQTVPAAPLSQTVVPADGETDDLAVDTAAAAPKAQTDIKPPASGKPESKPGIKADTRTGTPAKTAPKPTAAEAPASADDGGDENTDLQIAEPASQPAPVAANTSTPAQTPDTANIQTNAATETKGKVAQNGDAKKADPAAQDSTQNTAADNLAPKDAAPKDVAPKDVAKSDATDPAPDKAGKNNSIKSTAPKARAAQTDIADKTDTAKNDAPKSETSKIDAQPEMPNTTAASKAAPQPAPAALFAVNTIAAPQAQSSVVATATANAHVQVSAHPTPDLPALAVEIAAKSQSGAKQFDIRLDPPELGRVEVRLSIDATGKASAHLSADQPQTLSLLQKDAPILTRALRDAGLDVSQDGLNFSLRQQSENSSGNAGNNGRRGSSRSFPLTVSVSIDASAGSAAYRAASNGRLDIRV